MSETQGPAKKCLRPYVSLVKAGPSICLGHTWFTSVTLMGTFLKYYLEMSVGHAEAMSDCL